MAWNIFIFYTSFLEHTTKSSVVWNDTFPKYETPILL